MFCFERTKLLLGGWFQFELESLVEAGRNGEPQSKGRDAKKELNVK